MKFLHYVKARYSGSLDALDEIEEAVDLVQPQRLAETVKACLSLAQLLRECGNLDLSKKFKNISETLKSSEKELRDLVRQARSSHIG